MTGERAQAALALEGGGPGVERAGEHPAQAFDRLLQAEAGLLRAIDEAPLQIEDSMTSHRPCLALVSNVGW